MQTLKFLKDTTQNLVRFNGYELNLDTGELHHKSHMVPLRPRATRCLQLLVGRAGQMVTLDELRQELWGDIVVDWQAGVHQLIRQIRLALKDDNHELVVSVPRLGYRFSAEVSNFSYVGSAAVQMSRIGMPGVYLAGFATPCLLVIGFFAWCASLA